MKLLFSVTAKKELQEAVDYYDDISSSLVDHILEEVVEAQKHILFFPKAWAIIGENQRKYSLKKFPYLIIYKIYPNKIIILAFAHKHRFPEYYIGRK